MLCVKLLRCSKLYTIHGTRTVLQCRSDCCPSISCTKDLLKVCIMSSHSCLRCAEQFQSRNQLFKHVKVCGSTGAAADAAPGPAVAPLPLEASAGTCLYVTGGRHRGRTLSTVERYRPVENIWERCPSLSEGRGSHGCVSLNGVIFAIGGGGFHSNLANCEAFDGTAWKSIAPAPTVRHALTVVATAAKVYALGGWIDGSTCSSALECYDPEEDVWLKLAPMFYPRRLLGAVAMDGKIYTFGGNCEEPNWFTNKAEVYDIKKNEWQELTSVPSSGEMSANCINGVLYVIVHGNFVYRYNPSSDEYFKLSPLPLPEWFCFGTEVIGNSIIAYGGATVGKWSSKCFRYDTGSNSWLELAEMTTCRRRCAGAVVDYSTC